MLLSTGRFFNGDGGVPPASNDVVVIVAGQSNARSFDTTGSDVPVSLQDSDAAIKIWNTHTQAWQTYAAGTNSDTWNSGATTPQKWGPEAGFSHASRDADATRNIWIVKIAVDSTELAANAGEDWSPSNVGELFDDMDTEIAAAVAAMGVTPDEYVLLWMQGESDGQNATYANNYAVNLDDFITQVRSDWGDASTKVILGRISPSSVNSVGGTVRACQVKVAREKADTQAIDTDGYPLDAGDNQHYTAAGVQTMGEDMFDAYTGTYPVIPVRFSSHAIDKQASIVLTNDGMTAEGGGTSSSSIQTVKCDHFVTGGKRYWEFHIDAQIANLSLGIGKLVDPTTNGWFGQSTDAVAYHINGSVFKNNPTIVATYATYTAGDRIMVAFDEATGKVWFGKNGTWNGDPAAGTGNPTTLTTSTASNMHRTGVTLRRSGDRVSLKARAADFLYTVPTGFSPL